MPTDLDPIRAWPDVIRLVDHPDGNPQDPARDGIKRGGIRPASRGDLCGDVGIGDGHEPGTSYRAVAGPTTRGIVR